MSEAICAIKKIENSFMVYTFKDTIDMKENKVWDVWECKTVLADTGTINHLERIQKLLREVKRAKHT